MEIGAQNGRPARERHPAWRWLTLCWQDSLKVWAISMVPVRLGTCERAGSSESLPPNICSKHSHRCLQLNGWPPLPVPLTVLGWSKVPGSSQTGHPLGTLPPHTGHSPLCSVERFSDTSPRPYCTNVKMLFD